MAAKKGGGANGSGGKGGDGKGGDDNQSDYKKPPQNKQNAQQNSPQPANKSKKSMEESMLEMWEDGLNMALALQSLSKKLFSGVGGAAGIGLDKLVTQFEKGIDELKDRVLSDNAQKTMNSLTPQDMTFEEKIPNAKVIENPNVFDPNAPDDAMPDTPAGTEDFDAEEFPNDTAPETPEIPEPPASFDDADADADAEADASNTTAPTPSPTPGGGGAEAEAGGAELTAMNDTANTGNNQLSTQEAVQYDEGLPADADVPDVPDVPDLDVGSGIDLPTPGGG